jgi:hypothetical protein
MIVTIGDSVCWGQGLEDVHKFDRILADTWAGNAADLESENGGLKRLAHSGSILGAETDNSTETAYPEVPVAYPSVWQQLAAVPDWTDVDLLILNGGVNDVSLTRILNPWMSPAQIAQLTQQFCLGEMSRLLPVAAGKLVKAGARIAVLGYYPILSPDSKFDNPKQALMLMEQHGVATSSVALGSTLDPATLVPAIVANCMSFWNASDANLQLAVNQANATAGRDVCVFVTPGFTAENALWAGNPLLWEMSADLDALDEVKNLRDRACSALYGDLADLFTWAKCDRASVGHPNVEGASQIAATLAGKL